MRHAPAPWRHLAPTAPDTLDIYPFYNNDPFVVDECPHVFFAGNQAQYHAADMEGTDGQKVRVISVPSFALTGEAVLVDLVTLDSVPIKFRADVGAASNEK